MFFRMAVLHLNATSDLIAFLKSPFFSGWAIVMMLCGLIFFLLVRRR
jgi:hypothetical protein